MHFSNLFIGFSLASFAAAGCGDADACVGTEFCTTATFTSPSSTVVTTCVPTATCLGVYSQCDFGSTLGNCCSGYCAATKCRPTDDNWPGCNEDNGPCLADENCCYGNQCVEGLCKKPEGGRCNSV
ncbi:uncharacterized protein N7469_010162 [Penicillium citrinum]|uniref:Uncharacterized protein n=2 Tax=Penicillium TaxID=5073 RepID=A0A9W9NJR1_PENCI|nr:uncharacterized protein N7469_010162 [Penicillium citrinum]KAJ5221275.1 hypothetical protein N7469_010162 [Penicillium citrinum]KAJ5596244.1 hypothetical protein N7450_002702 [Penicillium hetheringtonii]